MEFFNTKWNSYDTSTNFITSLIKVDTPTMLTVATRIPSKNTCLFKAIKKNPYSTYTFMFYKLQELLPMFRRQMSCHLTNEKKTLFRNCYQSGHSCNNAYKNF